MQKGKIIVVDDDAFFRTLCTDILTSGGYSVKTASSGAKALEMIDKDHVDIVITDLVMPGMDGLELLENTKQLNALIDVIVVTGHGSLKSAITALKKGAFDYINKPLDEEELLLTVKSCMEKKELLEENQEMRQSLKLFEVSRTITTTLDINKLYNITIDAMLQMVPSTAGILAFFEEDGRTLEINSIRHLTIDSGEKILARLLETYETKLHKEVRGVTVIPVPEEPIFGIATEDIRVVERCSSIVIAPFMLSNSPVGYLFALSTLSPENFTARDVKSCDFIAEHASQAYANARKYVEAKEMAFIDSLTNLYNSKYLDTALERELRRADRLIMPVTVLFLDLDNFKLVNDRNDHLVGSKVLVEVGKILLKCVREVDTVIRYGGDEYVVILVDADSSSAFKVADRIRLTIEKNSFMNDEGLDLKVTASIGVATYPVHTKDKKELIKMADKAMYSAKGISKNLVYLAPVGED